MAFAGVCPASARTPVIALVTMTPAPACPLNPALPERTTPRTEMAQGASAAAHSTTVEPEAIAALLSSIGMVGDQTSATLLPLRKSAATPELGSVGPAGPSGPGTPA